MPRKLTTKQFIQKATQKHGDTYDYSKVEYNNSHVKVTIICKDHGEFKQEPSSHLYGCGCPKCGKKCIAYSKNPRISADSGTIWKTIPEYPKYEASSNGEIRNMKTKHILNGCIKSGYLSTKISGKSKKNHRLIALTFIPNPMSKDTVNHKNHNKLDNRVENLEWATVTEQNRHKRKCKKEILELVSSRPIWRIDKNTNDKLEYYITIKSAAKWVFDNNLTSVKKFNNGNNIKSKISAVAQGRRVTTFGYKWNYCNECEYKHHDEVWKPSSIHKVYGISNYGRVKNHKGRITEGYKHSSGYTLVSIASKQYLLHRLVALTFIPNPNGYQTVNHKDGNKKNNTVENLEWCSQSQNNQHAHDTGLQQNTIRVKLKEHNLEFSSCAKASEWVKENTNFKKASGGVISMGMKKRQDKVYGFTWEYMNNLNTLTN